MFVALHVLHTDSALSEHAATPTIEAARAARRFCLESPDGGRFTLTAIGLLASHLTTNILLACARHKSKRDVRRRIVAALHPCGGGVESQSFSGKANRNDRWSMLPTGHCHSPRLLLRHPRQRTLPRRPVRRRLLNMALVDIAKSGSVTPLGARAVASCRSAKYHAPPRQTAPRAGEHSAAGVGYAAAMSGARTDTARGGRSERKRLAVAERARSAPLAGTAKEVRDMCRPLSHGKCGRGPRGAARCRRCRQVH